MKNKFLEVKLAPIESDDPNWAAVFEGYVSTTAVDRYNEITLPTAFTETMPKYMSDNPILLFNHTMDNVVGQVQDYRIESDRVWIRAGISKATALSRDIAALVKAGILRTMSFMYRPTEIQPGENGKATTISKLDLYEISIVSIPANPGAIILDAKSKGINLDETTIKLIQVGEKTEVNMGIAIPEITALEKRFDEFAGPMTSAHEEAKSKLASMEKTITDLHQLQKLAKEKADQLATGLITQAEFKTYADKVSGDLVNVMKSLEQAKAASKLVDGKIGWSKWHSNLKTGVYKYLKDESGFPLPDIAQKSYHYFQAPVNYEKVPDGELLKKIRDAYDTCLITYQYMLGRKKQVNIQSLKSFQFLHDMMEHVDPEFAKAMYSTLAGSGDEWVPTLMSSELGEAIRINATLGNYFPRFNMPSNPYIWPILSAGAQAYIASEASTNSPIELTKTSLTTAKITFTAKAHAVAIPVSPELIEDAIVDIVAAIRSEIAYGLADGEEDALLNGDLGSSSDGTHRDTTTVTAAMTDDIRRAFFGLRFTSLNDSKSWDTQSATAGVGDAATTFGAKDVRYNRALMGGLGINPKECLYVTSPSPFFLMLSMSEFAKANEFGYMSTWYSGELPIVDGCQLYISGKLPETQGATGLCDSGSTHKSILCCNTTRGFKIGERRGVTLEFEKNIRTQQWTFVATARKDFQKMAPSTRYPVVNGYNIE